MLLVLDFQDGFEKCSERIVDREYSETRMRG